MVIVTHIVTAVSQSAEGRLVGLVTWSCGGGWPGEIYGVVFGGLVLRLRVLWSFASSGFNREVVTLILIWWRY